MGKIPDACGTVVSCHSYALRSVDIVQLTGKRGITVQANNMRRKSTGHPSSGHFGQLKRMHNKPFVIFVYSPLK
ncbi:hypothetical protein SprV_0200665900 [Sparganum proliferum]